MTSYELIKVESDGHVMTIGIDRGHKANAFDMQVCLELSRAFADYEHDDNARVAVLYGIGRNFISGMDLKALAPHIQQGDPVVAVDGLNPWQVTGRRLSKPVIAAVHGACFTLGLELVMACDMVVCTETARFAQLEPSVGLFPFGGSTVRMPRVAGWQNAMRWMLTSDVFDAQEAYRMGIVQQVVPDGDHMNVAMEWADKVASQAPKAVRAILSNADSAIRSGVPAAEQDLWLKGYELFGTKDGERGIDWFMSGGPRPVFTGE